MLRLLPHARPCVRHKDVGVLRRRKRIGHERDACACLLRIFLRPLRHPFIGRVVRRRRGDEVHARLCCRIHQRMRHVVAVADVRHLQPFEILALVFANRQEVGQRLARMEEIGQGVDDGNVGILGELLHLLMLEGADHHAIEIAR